jgi:hypothetical protein
MPKTQLVRSLSLAAVAATLMASAAPVHAQRSAPAASASGRIEVPPIGYKRRTLANGLTVYSLRDQSTANVHVQMLYDVGAKDDPAGRSGFAHLFEHILSRVTRNIAPANSAAWSKRKRAARATPPPRPTPPAITRQCLPASFRRCCGRMPSAWAARSSISRCSMPSAAS